MFLRELWPELTILRTHFSSSLCVKLLSVCLHLGCFQRWNGLKDSTVIKGMVLTVTRPSLCASLSPALLPLSSLVMLVWMPYGGTSGVSQMERRTTTEHHLPCCSSRYWRVEREQSWWWWWAVRQGWWWENDTEGVTMTSSKLEATFGRTKKMIWIAGPRRRSRQRKCVAQPWRDRQPPQSVDCEVSCFGCVQYGVAVAGFRYQSFYISFNMWNTYYLSGSIQDSGRNIFERSSNMSQDQRTIFCYSNIWSRYRH